MSISGIPTVGLAAISARLGANLWIAVGTGAPEETGAGQFNDDETTLYSELVRVPVQVFYSNESYLELMAALNATQGIGKLKEIGVFDAPSGGNMWVHYPMPEDNKPPTEGRVFTVRIPLSRQ